MANTRKEKSTYFIDVFLLTNMYERYCNGDKSITINMMKDYAKSSKVKILNLNVDGTDMEFLDSLKKSYDKAVSYKNK